jgi:hypothetical protein
MKRLLDKLRKEEPARKSEGISGRNSVTATPDRPSVSDDPAREGEHLDLAGMLIVQQSLSFRELDLI